MERLRIIKKKNFPVSEVRRFLEPGPVILVSSTCMGKQDIMALGWHMIMGEELTLIGCYIRDQNYSYELIKKSKECVINIPTVSMAETVVKIGNCSGDEIDKFDKFRLSSVEGDIVRAPLIQECYANIECKLVDSSLIKKYNLFIFEAVKAHVAITSDAKKNPKTIHYRGHGKFMLSGKTTNKYKKLFKSDYL